MTTIRIIGDRMLVALPPKDVEQDADTGFTFNKKGESPSGIIIAKPTEQYDVEAATRGIVMQLGEKRGFVAIDQVLDAMRDYRQKEVDRLTAEKGGTWWLTFSPESHMPEVLSALSPAPFDVAVGDCVVFAPSSGEQFVLDGINYVILREADVLGVLAPLSEVA